MSRVLPLAGRVDGVVEDQAGHQLGQRQPRLVGQALPLRRREPLGIRWRVEDVGLLGCRSARHGCLRESPLGTPMLRPNVSIPMTPHKPPPRRSAMPPRLPTPQPRDWDRPEPPGLTDGPVEHPRRNLQPPFGTNARQATAKRRPAGLLDDLVNMHPSTRPRVPMIEKFTLFRPVGVLRSSCTTSSGRTVRSDTGPQRQR